MYIILWRLYEYEL